MTPYTMEQLKAELRHVVSISWAQHLAVNYADGGTMCDLKYGAELDWTSILTWAELGFNAELDWTSMLTLEDRLRAELDWTSMLTWAGLDCMAELDCKDELSCAGLLSELSGLVCTALPMLLQGEAKLGMDIGNAYFINTKGLDPNTICWGY